MKKKKVDVENIFNCIGGAFLLWIGLSILDVITHSMTTHVYQAWNIFEIFF